MTRGGNPMKNARVRVRNSAAQLEQTYQGRADAGLRTFTGDPADTQAMTNPPAPSPSERERIKAALVVGRDEFEAAVKFSDHPLRRKYSVFGLKGLVDQFQDALQAADMLCVPLGGGGGAASIDSAVAEAKPTPCQSEWVLVPREATPAMLEAAWRNTVQVTPDERMALELGNNKAAFLHKMQRRYRALLAAAPLPPRVAGPAEPEAARKDGATIPNSGDPS